MSITTWIAAALHQLRSLFSNKEKIMTDQTVIEPIEAPVAAASTTAQPATSPLDDFANETALPTATVAAPVQDAVQPAAADPAVAEPAAAAPAVAAPDLANNEVATEPATAPLSAVQQDITAGVKDFAQAFKFVEQGVIKLGDAAKDELIALARKYL